MNTCFEFLAEFTRELISVEPMQRWNVVEKWAKKMQARETALAVGTAPVAAYTEETNGGASND